MSISYEGIGEWCATFVCGAVSEGDIVKVSANGTVGKCTAGDGFCGVVRAVAHDGLHGAARRPCEREVQRHGTCGRL